jgi:predicted metal-dependent enzyme (double-stranded beta helix superfamily)
MTFTNTLHKLPAALRFSRTTQDIRLIVGGQGVFVFEVPSQPSGQATAEFSVGSASGTPGLTVEWTSSAVIVTKEGRELKDPKNTKGLQTTPGAYYWFSIDSHNQRLYAGVGEARKETAIYTYPLPQDSETKTWMETLTHIRITDTIQPLRLLRDPITTHVPLHVKKTDALSMDDIAAATYMPSANLSPANQQLYNCISGKRFSLNTPDFPDFEEAIEYSIATPNCWCHETLKAKISTFGAPKETYLRITLNQNNGESPGVPHVMEIWPVGHYSPVHNHGGANAVIRVLRGTIHVELFAFLGGDVFGTADFTKGDITWITPTLNQVHKLTNAEGNTDTCITIQCYKYDEDDTRHYDYFDYIDQDGAVQQFDPDSDMDFLAFKERMRNEWSQRPKGIWGRMLGCLRV